MKCSMVKRLVTLMVFCLMCVGGSAYASGSGSVESVGGITLGMSKQAVTQIYGIPNRELHGQDTQGLFGLSIGGWYYQQDNWLIHFSPASEKVDAIVIFKGSSRSLDNSRLNCSSPLGNFAGAYGLSQAPVTGSVVRIGDGEYLSFGRYPDSLMLTSESSPAALADNAVPSQFNCMTGKMVNS